MKPILDIITITRDNLEGVARTIRSTAEIRNKYNIRQAIIDSSSEGNKIELKKLVRAERNIDYFWQEPRGISAAFNFGIERTKARWIWFLNGGDTLHMDINLEFFFYLVNASKADVLMFELEFMQSGKRQIHPPLWALWPPVRNWIPHPASIIRRELFERYGVFSPRFNIAVDWDLWMRFLTREDVVVDTISVPLVVFDQNGLSTVRIRETSGEMRNLIIIHLWTLLKIWLKHGKSIFEYLVRYTKRSIFN